MGTRDRTLSRPGSDPSEDAGSTRHALIRRRTHLPGIVIGVDVVFASGRCRPHQFSGLGLAEDPAVGLFYLVVAAAQCAEVVWAAWAADIPCPGVIDVASGGGLSTHRKSAGTVASLNTVA